MPLFLLAWGCGSLAAASVPGLPASPLLTQVLLPGLAFSRWVAIAITIGGLLALVLSDAVRVRRWTLAWGSLALALVAIGALAMSSDVAAADPVASVQSGALLEVLTGSIAGQALVVQFFGLLIAVALTASMRSRGAGWVALGLGLVAAAAPAVAGHAGLSGTHGIAGVSVGLHAAAMCLWVGGLAVVVGLLLAEPERAAKTLPRFSLLAAGCVVVVAETGLLTATLNVGALSDLAGSTYGSLVLAKAVMLAWLIRLGWLQRRQVMDRLPSTPALTSLARLAGIEFLTMGAALAAATIMVRIGPPAVASPGIAPLTLIALGLGAPMVTVLMRPRGWRVSDGLPEAAVVALLIVMVEVGGVGLIRTLLGGIGLVIELVLLVVVGWLAVSALRLPRSRPAAILAAVGLPVAFIAIVRMGDLVSWRMAVVAVIAGEGLLLAWWRRWQVSATSVAREPATVVG